MAAYPSSIRFLGLGKVADYPIDTRHRLWQLSDLPDSESDSEFRKFLSIASPWLTSTIYQQYG